MSFHAKSAMALLALGLSVATASIASAQSVELKVCHFVPPNHSFHKAMLAWGEELGKASGGKLTVKVYPAGQLGGGANRLFDAARNGICDVAISLHGATPGRYMLTELASLPFTAPKDGTKSATTSKRLTELAPTYLAKEHEGVRILWMAVTSPLMFHSKAPIRSIADFKGLKIRYAGAQYKNIVDALGAAPVPVPPQEAQDALSKGIIDATTFPYEGAASFDIGSVAKYTLEPGLSSATFAVVMNPAKYTALPAEWKQLIDKTTGPQAAEAFGKQWDEAEVEGKKSLLSKGVTVSVLADTELAKMKQAFAPQVDAAIGEAEKKGLPGRNFYDAYLK